MTSAAPPGAIAHDVSAVFPLQNYLPSELDGTVSADGLSASGFVANRMEFPVASKHLTVNCTIANSVRWTLQSVSQSH